MSKLSEFVQRFRRPRKPPVILTDAGPVTESMRLQAALNMRADPAIKALVLKLLEAEGRSPEVARRVAMERYPEAGW